MNKWIMAFTCRTKPNDTLTELDTENKAPKSNDSLADLGIENRSLEIYDTKKIMEKYNLLTMNEYNSDAMMALLDEAVVRGTERRLQQAAGFDKLLQRLLKFDISVRSDMGKWATERIKAMQAFVLKEYAGSSNLDWTYCAYAVDKIDFLAMFIVPRLPPQLQRQYALLDHLKKHVEDLWRKKQTVTPIQAELSCTVKAGNEAIC